MRKLLFGLAVCTVWVLTQGLAAAATGKALGVDPAAEAKRKAETQQLTVGSDIFIGDRVITGASGQVQIKFDDQTELVVGPNSSLLIEDFLLREDGSAGKLAINALAGTFRFVTGGAPKDRYSIKTPTGTIGVRGTAFDFFVTPLVTSVLLYHGSVLICDTAGTCETLADVCELGQYEADRALVIGNADGVTGAARATLRAMFMYALTQRPLLQQFRIQGAERCLNRPAPGGQGDGPGNDEDAVPGSPPPPPKPTPPPDPPILTFVP